ncbi:MAG: FadR/GntR family transcriptional regulator [Lachnospiraceae bacterium]|nr:FadR/GntR family transcriptional regulator [Lachnospiraceae bacterium]
MGDVKLSSLNKKDNVRYLRRYLGLTQKDFINQFLTNENGKPSMSVATFSNLEAKGGTRLNEVILSASESLGIDVMLFSMDGETFAERLDLELPSKKETQNINKIRSQKGNIKQLVYRLTMYFSEKLFDKELKKGDKVESDRVLAEKLGVGRSAIREALKVLDVLGMIDIRPGQGTFITNNESNFFIIPLSWSLFMNGNQTDNILTVRNTLEIKAAELAAISQKTESLEKLHQITSNIHAAYMEKDYKKFLECDLEFHICIAECSGNQVIYSMIQTISNLMRRVSGTGMINEEQLRQIKDEHQLIYGAILSKDGTAASKAMSEHLHRSMERYNYR